MTSSPARRSREGGSRSEGVEQGVHTAPAYAGATPAAKGKLTPNAPLAPLVWFKSGGAADWLFEPKDLADLQDFLRALDPAVPVMARGLGSNMIVRDGGVPGVVIRLGRGFGDVKSGPDHTITAGTAVPDVKVARAAADVEERRLESLLLDEAVEAVEHVPLERREIRHGKQ